jgi:hypothetical protein
MIPETRYIISENDIKNLEIWMGMKFDNLRSNPIKEKEIHE